MKIYLPEEAKKFLIGTLRKSEQYVDSEDYYERTCARRSVRIADYLERIRYSPDGFLDIRAEYYEPIMAIIIADYEDFHRGMVLKTAGGRK